ncbi:MAG: hypothetical protein ABIO24_09495, partial [Saprospiraceae bacterium]
PLIAPLQAEDDVYFHKICVLTFSGCGVFASGAVAKRQNIVPPKRPFSPKAGKSRKRTWRAGGPW